MAAALSSQMTSKHLEKSLELSYQHPKVHPEPHSLTFFEEAKLSFSVNTSQEGVVPRTFWCVLP